MNKNAWEEISVNGIASGKAIEQTDFQLARAIENCLDPNTEATAIRKVVLTLSLKPNADRTKAEISHKVDVKLQCDAPGVDIVQLSRTHKKGYVMVAEQMNLDELIEKEREQNGIETLKTEEGSK